MQRLVSIRQGCGTRFLNRTIDTFPTECVSCGRGLDEMRVKRAEKEG